MHTTIPRKSVKRIDGLVWNELINKRPGRLELGGDPGSRAGVLTIRNDAVNDEDDPIDLETYDIVKLGDPVHTVADSLAKFKDAVVLTGETPDASGIPFAILQEAAKAGMRAVAVESGVTQVRVKGTGSYADCTADGKTDYLECGNSGPARVLWSEAGTGERWGVVQISVRSTTERDALQYGSYTMNEYDPASGAVLRNFDRGRPRAVAQVVDFNCIVSTDGYLYSGGSGFINQDTGVLAKWDMDTGELLWYSAAGVLNSPPLSGGTLLDQCIFEASDGFIWTCGTYVARHDPATGEQTHELSLAGSQLMRADGSGGVVVAGSAGVRVLDATLTQTASVTTVNSIEEHGGRLYCIRGTSLLILNAADLTTIDSRTVPGGETYAALATDGTTVWTITNDHYRAYDAANLATETWNASRTANGTVVRLIHDGSSLYEFGTGVRKVSDSTGAVAWTTLATATPANGMPALGQTGAARRRMGCAVGSDFVLCCSQDVNGATLWCYNDSDGSARWCDHFSNFTTGTVGAHGVAIMPGERVFACGVRTLV